MQEQRDVKSAKQGKQATSDVPNFKAFKRRASTAKPLAQPIALKMTTNTTKFDADAFREYNK